MVMVLAFVVMVVLAIFVVMMVVVLSACTLDRLKCCTWNSQSEHEDTCCEPAEHLH
jgi:hypothetical protein